jgi:hypothetical protein
VLSRNVKVESYGRMVIDYSLSVTVRSNIKLSVRDCGCISNTSLSS